MVVLDHSGTALRPQDISGPLGGQHEMHSARISNVDTIRRLYDTLRYVSDALLNAAPVRFKTLISFISQFQHSGRHGDVRATRPL